MWLWLWNWKISVVSASNIGLLVALSIWWTGLPIESIGRSNLFNSMPEFCTHVIQFNSKSLFMMMIFCYNKPVVHNVSSERIFQWQWFLWLLNYHQNYGSQHHNYDDHHYNYDGLHSLLLAQVYKPLVKTCWTEKWCLEWRNHKVQGAPKKTIHSVL